MPPRSRTIGKAQRDRPAVARRSIAAGVLASVLAGALACATGCSPALDWRQFSWPAGGFAVLMPATPSEETREISIGTVRLNLHLYSASAAGNEYAAGFAELPVALDERAHQQLLEDAQNGFARNMQGAPGSFEVNSLEGFPCRQFSIAGKPQGRAVELAARVCATDRRFYQVVYLGPAENTRNADVPLFLASLKLLL